MRRAVIAVIIALVIVFGIAFLIYRLTRKPLPTPPGWKAQVTTIAGDGSPLVLSDPFGVAVSGDGSVYFTDAGEHNSIKKIDSQGKLTTIAGGEEGSADGVGGNARFNTPSGIAFLNDDYLVVADTSNNTIRKVSVRGETSTIAGNGTDGFADGPAASAQFNGPIGVAVDAAGNVFIADSYNDRIRRIGIDGQVSTVAGGGTPGYADGDRNSALFDTPSGIVVGRDGSLIVADTGNDRLRRISPEGNVSTLSISDLSSPIGLALTHDDYLYVTERDRSRVVQIAPDGTLHIIAGRDPGIASGGDETPFKQPAGIAIAQSRNGAPQLYVADCGNRVLRRLDQTANAGAGVIENLPKLTNETLGQEKLLWPIDPQDRPHEVAATMGEVRGSFESDDSRHHLHSGLDVFAGYGQLVRAVRSEKVTGPLSNWGFGSLNEGMRVNVVSYIHMQVGRDQDSKMLADSRFIPVSDSEGRVSRVRIRRGTRFNPGDELGTVNRMYHVHLNIGPPGGEINPLWLSPVGFIDTIPPTIERDGIQLFDENGSRLQEKQEGRLLVQGSVRIVVDAFDRANMNAERRRLGLYKLGYQLLKPDGTPASDFNGPRVNIVFDRLPRDREATKLAYAPESGITVYGSQSTRFLYEITNIVRDGRVARGIWDTSELPKGDYVLRIIAQDFSGNEAVDGRDLPVTVR